MRFALDEDVSRPLVGPLRSRGYDTDSAKELRRLGLSDVDVVVRSADAGQALVTHNDRDVRTLRGAWLRWRGRWRLEIVAATGVEVALSGHAGIIVVPHLPNYDLAQIIQPFAEAADQIDDRLFAWTNADGWLEPLPIGP